MNKKMKDIGYIIILKDNDGDMFVADCYDLTDEVGNGRFRSIDKHGYYILIPHIALTWDKKVYCKYYNRYNRTRVIKKALTKYPEARV